MRDFNSAMNDMMAYLTMMAQRLAELDMSPQPTGMDIYLSTATRTASHYKLLMDAPFDSLPGRDSLADVQRLTGLSKAIDEVFTTSLFSTKSNGYGVIRRYEKAR